MEAWFTGRSLKSQVRGSTKLHCLALEGEAGVYVPVFLPCLRSLAGSRNGDAARVNASRNGDAARINELVVSPFPRGCGEMGAAGCETREAESKKRPEGGRQSRERAPGRRTVRALAPLSLLPQPRGAYPVKRLVHAVFRVGNNEGRELVLPAGLRCLVSGDLAIAFCAVAVKELTPTVPRLEAFATTVAELHRNHTTIPFRFGCTVESDSQLVALPRSPISLALHARSRRAVRRVQRSLAATSRVLNPPGPARENSRRSANHRAGRPGTNYLMTRRNTLRRASAVRNQARARAEQVRQTLDGLYRSYEIKPPIPGRETLVTLVFLVPRASSTAFLSAVQAASHPVSGHLLATGPWPPYHFTAPLSELESSALMRN